MDIHQFARNGIYKTDKMTKHSYLQNYYIAALERPIARMLEIGVYKGESLRLWRDAFQHAAVTGIDTCEMPAITNVALLRMDAYTDKTLWFLPPKFDVIIDDGPHTLESHLKFCNLYLPLIDEGGIAVIEDIPTYVHYLAVAKRVEDMGYAERMIDLRAVDGVGDSMLMEIKAK